MYKTSNVPNFLQPLDHLGPWARSSRDGWQRCCRDALPHRLEVVVGRVELHPSLGISGDGKPPIKMKILGDGLLLDLHGFTTC